MADFNKAFKKFKGIEFSSAENVLHQNEGENGLTYYGVYQSAHPHWNGWSIIMAHLTTHGFNQRSASISAYHDAHLTQEVMSFYYMKYWVTLRLDDVHSQKIAEELFFFYLNIGSKKRVVRYAQSIVDTVVDGQIGFNTVTALNNFDENVFDREYDKKEISHYKRLVRARPKRFSRFLRGWINRARLI